MNNENNNQNTEMVDHTERNKKTMRVVVILVIVAVIAVLAIGSAMKHRATAPTVTDEAVEGCKEGYLFSETTGKPCPKAGDTMMMDTKDTKAMTTTAPSGYEAAVHAYAGKIVLFDGSCVAMPATTTVAAGTRILVGNNSDQALTLAVGDKSEKLDGYHYFTTALKTAGDVTVQCNGTDAAMVTVQ